MDAVSVGLLGCGTISDAYLDAADRFDAFEIEACADLDPESAAETAEAYDLRACSPETLREDPGIEAVVNLTPPEAHAETIEGLLDAGKHVYVEKPIAATVEGARRIAEAARRSDCLVGAAPDTVLGAGLQTARSVLDSGRIGDPIGSTAIWTSGGHESWHPNPAFYYHEGGGPLFDMGPYYVTALVSLLGPVERVTGAVSRAFDEREITSEPRAGESIEVEVPTHESGVLEFADGTVATLTTSFDAPGGSTLPAPAFEIYGTEGTLALPDPNHFEGPVRVSDRDADGFESVELTHSYTAGRGAGVADLSMAIRGDWAHRTDAALATHVLSVLAGLRDAAERGERVPIEPSATRPAPLPQHFPDVDPDE